MNRNNLAMSTVERSPRKGPACLHCQKQPNIRAKCPNCDAIYCEEHLSYLADKKIVCKNEGCAKPIFLSDGEEANRNKKIEESKSEHLGNKNAIKLNAECCDIPDGDSASNSTINSMEEDEFDMDDDIHLDDNNLSDSKQNGNNPIAAKVLRKYNKNDLSLIQSKYEEETKAIIEEVMELTKTFETPPRDTLSRSVHVNPSYDRDDLSRISQRSPRANGDRKRPRNPNKNKDFYKFLDYVIFILVPVVVLLSIYAVFFHGGSDIPESTCTFEGIECPFQEVHNATDFGSAVGGIEIEEPDEIPEPSVVSSQVEDNSEPLKTEEPDVVEIPSKNTKKPSTDIPDVEMNAAPEVKPSTEDENFVDENEPEILPLNTSELFKAMMISKNQTILENTKQSLKSLQLSIQEKEVENEKEKIEMKKKSNKTNPSQQTSSKEKKAEQQKLKSKLKKTEKPVENPEEKNCNKRKLKAKRGGRSKRS